MSRETFATGIPPEVAPVRPGEELDWDRARPAYLAEHLDVAGELTVLQFPNGSANLTYLLTFGAATAVVSSSCCAARRSASSRPAPTT